MARRNTIDDVRFNLLGKVWELNDSFWQWTLQELADEAGLSYTTVWRLYTERTVDCKSSTLLKLVGAVGLHIELCGVNAKVKDVLKKIAA